MLYWTRFPFIRITLVFAAGIAAGYLIHPELPVLLVISAGLAGLYFFLGKSFKRRQFIKFNGPIAGSAFTLVFILGLLRTSLFFHSGFDEAETLQITSSSAYFARIDNPTGQTEKFIKTIGRILVIHDGHTWHSTDRKVLLYFPKNQKIRYGDFYLVNGHPELIRPPLNPHAFNYRTYMARRKVSMVHFLKNSRYHFIENRPHYPVMALAFEIKNHITALIDRATVDDRVQAMLTALLTGQRDYFDEETYADFTRTGIVHVLAVSGLHVGILYMILTFMMKPLTLTSKSRLLRILLIISCFMLFAMVTGLSPSVLRAVLMFSLILLGQSIQRNAHILNTVFLSAFILLLIHPMLLFETGFQLSYMAVIGIILYQPLLYSFTSPKYKWLDWLWKLITVSVAAQIATLPLTLYYFKQFPAYFLPANIIAIPFISVFIPLAIIWLGTSPFEPVHRFLSQLLDLGGRQFLNCIEWIGELPGSLISPVYLSPVQLVSLLILAGSFFIMFNYRKPRMLWVLAGSVMMIIGCDALHHFSHTGKKQIVQHLIPSSFCIELVNGKHTLLIMENEDIRHKKQYDFHVRNYCVKNKHNHTTVTMGDLDKMIPAIQAGNRKIFCWEGITFCFYRGKEKNLSKEAGIRYPDMIITENGLISNRDNHQIRKEKGLHTLVLPAGGP